ncbi:CRTAC1 family protein [Flavobacteriaceae bacterium]|nr:CRTAC1 family protein [Flavobacteriaceae bacterium]
MKVKYFLWLLFFVSTIKINSQELYKQGSSKNSSDTFSMVDTLKTLYLEGNPVNYYHWNEKLAALYLAQISKVEPEKKIITWFKYCQQLLKAGEIQTCINEIENLIIRQKLTYQDLITKDLLPIIDLLAISYLRLGEVNNCQNNHNSYSCILPLKDQAFHIDVNGSKKAIEIYTQIYEKFPNDNYKWLLNLAHMTIGEHPNNVPERYRINYPNWNIEQKKIKAFKEVSSKFGIAQDGLSGGVSIDDFNNDGLLDIFITSYGMSDQSKLYTNTSNGFIDTTEEAGLTGIVSGLNCIHADYDNDGNIDIFVLRGAWLGEGGNHPNSLLKNNGDGTFNDVTKSAGLLSFHPTQTASWADVNNDGYLDLFVGNESNEKQSHPCELYINQKDGSFIEESSNYNLSSIEGFVKGVVFGDINNDKWPDLYISVMGGNNLLFKNNFGKFENISETAGIQGPNFSFPTWFWDVNNDGFNDILVASYDTRNIQNVAGDFVKELQGEKVLSDKSKLYINNGDETFSEQSNAFNIDKSFYAMGSNFGDLDNDGWLDFYIGTGSPEFTSVVPNRMFRNVDGISFEEVTSAGGFGHIQKGHGVSFADLDNDGDQDIYAVLGGAYQGDNYTNVCFENPTFENNWVILNLEGVQSNRSAIGTKLKLDLDNGRTIFYTINTGGSFGSNSLQAEIGLGQSKMIQTLTIIWPSSDTQIFNSVAVNKKHKLSEGQNKLIEVPYEKVQFLSKELNHHKK